MGASDAVDQPLLGSRLHPDADHRDQLAPEKEPEIAVAHGPQGIGQVKCCDEFIHRGVIPQY